MDKAPKTWCILTFSMTTFEKAFWSVGNSEISVALPIAKVNEERRTVSGWATTDVLDKQGDIVPIESSNEAFSRFGGYVREMHAPIAVGQVVDFRVDKVYDPEQGKFANGVFVNVYVSKGAEPTWQKVLDGTLRSFSIGGNIVEATVGPNGERVITKYDLNELSLVDNPGNQLSNFVSIQKFDGTQEVEKNYLETVYWCPSSDTLVLSEQSEYLCPDCNKNMTNVGFVESTDLDKESTAKSLVESFTKSVANSNEKEGMQMGFLNRKITKEVVEEFAPTETVVTKSEVVEEATPAVEETAEVAIEKSEPVAEATEEVAEAAAEEAPVVEETAEVEAPAEEVASVEKAETPEESNDETIAKAIVDALGELTTVVKGLSESFDAFKKASAESVEELQGEVTKVAGRVEAVEADTAVRKSGDLGGVTQGARKVSKWGGRFLSTADL